MRVMVTIEGVRGRVSGVREVMEDLIGAAVLLAVECADKYESEDDEEEGE